MIQDSVPVLVVGGGVVGLSAALFLFHQGVPCLLIECRSGTSIHPRARGVNIRTMEFYRELRLDETVRTAGASLAPAIGILSGDTLVHALEGFHADTTRTAFSGMVDALGEITTTTSARITQDLLEPVLLKSVQERGGALRFSTELVSFTQDDEGITVLILDRTSGEKSSLLQKYCLAGAFPVVLGGDCSILLGTMLALRRTGRYGLVFIDGHLDFRHPGNSETIGAAAGEDLALVTGRGGRELTNLEESGPLVQDSDVVAIGFRPDDEDAVEVQQTNMTAFNVADIQRHGPTQVGFTVLEMFQQSLVEGYWIHLDADVLDPMVMPAVDTPTPGGLSVQDLIDLLHPLLTADAAVGLDVTVFDPDLDPDGVLAQRLTDTIVAALKILPEDH